MKGTEVMQVTWQTRRKQADREKEKTGAGARDRKQQWKKKDNNGIERRAGLTARTPPSILLANQMYGSIIDESASSIMAAGHWRSRRRQNQSQWLRQRNHTVITHVLMNYTPEPRPAEIEAPEVISFMNELVHVARRRMKTDGLRWRRSDLD